MVTGATDIFQKQLVARFLDGLLSAASIMLPVCSCNVFSVLISNITAIGQTKILHLFPTLGSYRYGSPATVQRISLDITSSFAQPLVVSTSTHKTPSWRLEGLPSEIDLLRKWKFKPSLRERKIFEPILFTQRGDDKS